MPVPTTFGVFASGAAGSSAAAFVAKNEYTPSTSSQAVSFSGAAAGNLAIIIVSNSTGGFPPTPAGWTSLGGYTWPVYSYNDTAFIKVLSAGDISTGSVTLTALNTDSTVQILFYAGATTAAVVGSAATSSTTVTIPGFTKNANCKGIVLYCTTRQTVASPSAPGTAVNRIANFASANFKSRADDILNPSNYVDGSGLPYTNAGSIMALARAIELR